MKVKKDLKSKKNVGVCYQSQARLGFLLGCNRMHWSLATEKTEKADNSLVFTYTNIVKYLPQMILFHF